MSVEGGDSALAALNEFSYIGAYDGAVYGGDGDGWGWTTALWAVLIILVLLVVWKVSDFRKDRLCISTDLREYWPTGQWGLPALPGQDYLPAVSQYLPARESLTPPTINRSRTDDTFKQAMLGY